MRPITFKCEQSIQKSGSELCVMIADMAYWSEFNGYGILPGVESAEYRKRTPTMVGSQISVRNTDGSAHVEEITQWVDGQAITMKMHEFSPPLRHLATHIIEEWEFQAASGGTLIGRKFSMYPRNHLTRPLLWLISLLMQKAIAQNLAEMAAA